MIDDLDGMAVVVAVVEAKGFRAAGERLGVSGSAVSHALQRLEARLGVALVQRTTRVHLTEAGERHYAAVRPALDEVRAPILAVGELADHPSDRTEYPNRPSELSPKRTARIASAVLGAACRIAAVDDDLGALAGELHGDRTAEAGGCARDQGLQALEVAVLGG